MADKIAQGRLNKFFQESTLLSQPFVRDNKLSVDEVTLQIDLFFEGSKNLTVEQIYEIIDFMFEQ